MTSEIALLNKQGLVLAADSAVTVGEGKVYNSARKLFTLTPQHSIGLMVFGVAEFMGIPWEIIIQRFSDFVGKEPLSTVKSYSEKMIDFLMEDEIFQDKSMQHLYVYNYSKELSQLAFQQISPEIDKHIEQGEVVDSSLILEKLQVSLSNLKDIAEKNDAEIYLEKNIFIEEFKDTIIKALDNVSTIKEVTDAVTSYYLEVFYSVFISNLNISGYSGIVIAGYGKDEIFPNLLSYRVKAIIMGNLKYSPHKSVKIGHIFEENASISSIMPFAQEDVISTVITGMAPELNQIIFSELDEMEGVKEDDKNRLLSNLANIQQQYFIDPMLNTIQILPIDEVAEVAETLINLTSFKRKYTSDLATVGGPIDVLAITFKEGPIWIKRKHYFDINKNFDYKKRKENS